MKKHFTLLFLTTQFLFVTLNASAKETTNESQTTKTTTKISSKDDVKKLYKLDTKKYLKDWSLIIHGGTTSPFTDIRTYDWARATKPKSELQWGAGVGLTKMLSNAFGLNLDYTISKLQGATKEKGGFAEDRYYWKQLGFDQPIYFKTDLIHQTTLNFYINWMGLSFGYNKFIKSQITNKPIKPRRFAVYNKIGIGLLRTATNIYNIADDKPVNGNAYLRGYTNKFTEVVFPISFGMKYKISKSFDLGLEGTFTFTSSDKLDAFNFDGSKGNLSLSKINRDAYSYMNINLTYKFGKIKSQAEHVEWVNPLEMIMAYVDKNKVVVPPAPNLNDTDKDGVLDILDKEPNTPEGYRVDANGVTLDSDKDGCPDSKDPEPFSTPQLAIVDCKNVKPFLEETRIVRDSITTIIQGRVTDTVKVEKDDWKLISIYFDLNKYAITPAAATQLKQIASTMKKRPDLIVEVQAHTDSRGSMTYNQKLSENRADAAVNYLIKNFGISKDRFKELPLGMTDPTVKGATNENQHQVNRRVDFIQFK